MNDLSAKGKRSRRRGKTGERELCKELDRLGLPGFRRSQQNTGRHGDADIENSIIETELLIECKRVERISINAVMKRAMEDAHAKNRIPVIAHRKNHHPWLLTICLDDLWGFVEELLRLQVLPETVLEEMLAEQQQSSPDQ